MNGERHHRKARSTVCETSWSGQKVGFFPCNAVLFQPDPNPRLAGRSRDTMSPSSYRIGPNTDRRIGSFTPVPLLLNRYLGAQLHGTLRVTCPSRPCPTYRKVFRPVHFYFNVSENSSTFKFSTRVKYVYIKPFSFDHDHIRTQRYFFQRCSSGLWRRVDSWHKRIGGKRCFHLQGEHVSPKRRYLLAGPHDVTAQNITFTAGKPELWNRPIPSTFNTPIIISRTVHGRRHEPINVCTKKGMGWYLHGNNNFRRFLYLVQQDPSLQDQPSAVIWQDEPDREVRTLSVIIAMEWDCVSE
jgi:hypothetical protein